MGKRSAIGTGFYTAIGVFFAVGVLIFFMVLIAMSMRGSDTSEPPGQQIVQIAQGEAEPWTVSCIGCGLDYSAYRGEYVEVVCSIALPPGVDVFSYEGLLTVRLGEHVATQRVGYNLPEDVEIARRIGEQPFHSQRDVGVCGATWSYDDSNAFHRDLRYATPDDLEVEFELIDWQAAD